jgi:hypothetical protein
LKRWVWLLVALFAIYVVLEGLASSYVIGTYTVRPAELVFDDGAVQRRFPVWLRLSIAEPQPEGSALAIAASGSLFGVTTTYALPVGIALECWHTPFASFCPAGWSYVFTEKAAP